MRDQNKNHMCRDAKKRLYSREKSEKNVNKISR